MKKMPVGFSIACASAALLLSVAAVPPRSAVAADPSPALKQIIEDAKKEGRFDLQYTSDLLGRVEGVDNLIKGMNAMYGTSITARVTPDPASIVQLLNKIGVTQSAGQPAPTDAFIGTTGHITIALARNMIQPVAWPSLLPGRIDDSMVEGNGMTVRVFTSLPGGIIYNTRLAPMKPTSLMDLLKPEWKGKVASTPYAASFNVLAATDVWGEEKALDFARKLSAQLTGVVGCQEVLERLASGEYVAFAMDCLGRDWVKFKRQGAPLDFVVPSDYASKQYYYMAIPKNAAHPNVGKLFVAFLLTPEGQDILWKAGDIDLHSFPNSGMGKVIAEYEAQGRQFREITLDWWAKHPEVGPAQSKAVEILTRK